MVPTSVIGEADKGRRTAAAASISNRLDTLLEDLPALLRSMFEEAWNLPGSKSGDWEYLGHVSDEVGGLIAASDRDLTTLKWQLPLTIRHHGLDPTKILDTFLPLPTDFHVACLIRGAGRFSRLTMLEPTAQQTSSAVEDAIRWGPATERLRGFLSDLTINADDCVISIDVNAIDKASAARLGRRRVTELLDQYVAGHRLLRVLLTDDTLVARAGTSETEKWQPTRKGVHQAYPLIYRWPEGLRETLRMGHIARDADSPLTAAALSWVAIEASGVKHSKHTKQLARALSLQALRQQVVETYQLVKQSGTASRQYAIAQAQAALSLVKTYQTAVARCPLGHPVYGQLMASQQSAEVAHAQAERLSKDLDDRFSKFADSIDAYVAVDENTRLQDLNQWMDVLLPARNSDSTELVSARSALGKIIPRLSPLAARQVTDWRQRLGAPRECAQWLSATQARMEELLDVLYSARNLALHSGVFAATADTVLGQGGVMLVDFILEFLGNWYRNTPTPQTRNPPLQVIGMLADRQTQIIRKLNSSKRGTYPLNIGRLTSPSSADGWDRS
jgi:hypothetical protein